MKLLVELAVNWLISMVSLVSPFYEDLWISWMGIKLRIET